MSNLSEFFSKLERDQWSGEVQVTASEGHAIVVISKGRFLYAHRPFDRAAERVEAFGWVKMPPPEVISSFKSWDEFLKSVLNMNSENYDRLIRYFKADRFELFFRIFFWSNIELLPHPYELNAKHNPELNIYSPKELKKLLKEAETRLREWPSIQKRVGSSRRVFISTIPTSENSARFVDQKDAIDLALDELDEMDGNFSNTQEIGPYAEEEMDIVRLCDGRHSLQDIIRLSPDGEFLTLRRVLELWDKGIILPKDEEPSLNARERRPRPTTPRDFKTLGITTMIGLFLAVTFNLLDQKSSVPQAIPTQLEQALEVYRNLYGRYPVTINELKYTNILEGGDATLYDYQLLNPKRYSLRPHRSK